MCHNNVLSNVLYFFFSKIPSSWGNYFKWYLKMWLIVRGIITTLVQQEQKGSDLIAKWSWDKLENEICNSIKKQGYNSRLLIKAMG